MHPAPTIFGKAFVGDFRNAPTTESLCLAGVRVLINIPRDTACPVLDVKHLAASTRRVAHAFKSSRGAILSKQRKRDELCDAEQAGQAVPKVQAESHPRTRHRDRF